MDIKALTAKLVADCKQAAESASLSVVCKLDERVPSRVATDRNHVAKVIGHLLSNAIKFSPAGKTVQVLLISGVPHEPPKSSVTFGSARFVSESKGYERSGFVIIIKDEGCGVRQENLKHIFEAYRQTKETTTRNFGGKGLGLSILKKLVESLEGSIYLDSTVGKGTIFSVFIPYRSLRSVHNVQQATYYSMEGTIRNAEKINLPAQTKLLFAEDDALSRKLYKRWINKIKVKCAFNTNGMELVRAAENALKADPKTQLIVMTDIHMPTLGGLQAVKEILKLKWEQKPLFS